MTDAAGELKIYRIALGSVVQLLAAVNPAMPLVVRFPQEQEFVQFKIETLNQQNNDEKKKKTDAAKQVFDGEIVRQQRAYKESTRKEFGGKLALKLICAVACVSIVVLSFIDRAWWGEMAFCFGGPFLGCAFLEMFTRQRNMLQARNLLTGVVIGFVLGYFGSVCMKYHFTVTAIILWALAVMFCLLARVDVLRRQKACAAIRNTADNMAIWSKMETDINAFFKTKNLCDAFLAESHIYTLDQPKFETAWHEMQHKEFR